MYYFHGEISFILRSAKVWHSADHDCRPTHHSADSIGSVSIAHRLPVCNRPITQSADPICECAPDLRSRAN